MYSSRWSSQSAISSMLVSSITLNLDQLQAAGDRGHNLGRPIHFGPLPIDPRGMHQQFHTLGPLGPTLDQAHLGHPARRPKQRPISIADLFAFDNTLQESEPGPSRARLRTLERMVGYWGRPQEGAEGEEV
jgi:hypothetical protein